MLKVIAAKEIVVFSVFVLFEMQIKCDDDDRWWCVLDVRYRKGSKFGSLVHCRINDVLTSIVLMLFLLELSWFYW